MTLIETQNKLFEFFRTNDHFITARDWRKIIPISENEELDKEIINLALTRLAFEHKLVACITRIGKPDIWVLEKPFSHYDQQVTLTADTILSIADILNSSGEKSAIADVTQIKEQDIRNLCLIIYNLANKDKVENS